MSLPSPTPVGGWNMQFTMWRCFPDGISGSVSGLITKSTTSGYGGGQSGITVANSGNGQWNVALFRTDLSGNIDAGPYAWRLERLDSGSAKIVCEGFRILT